jgi:hypothetical protein
MLVTSHLVLIAIRDRYVLCWSVTRWVISKVNRRAVDDEAPTPTEYGFSWVLKVVWVKWDSEIHYPIANRIPVLQYRQYIDVLAI